MNEREFVEILESFYKSKTQNEKLFRIGNVSSTYTSGLPRVLLDGDDGVGDVVYPHLFSYAPSANDRVLLIRFGTTYLILGKINNDGSPSGGGGVGGTTVDWGNVTGKPSTFTPSAHTHSWSDVTGKPTTFTPSAHTHLITDVDGLQTALDGKASSSHTHSWSSITSKPTTFAPEAHTHLWADITDKPSTFTPSTHSHAWADITGKPSTFTPSAHTHLVADISNFPSQTGNSGKVLSTDGTNLAWVTPSGGGGAVDWADITGKPTTFTPSTHSHAISDVTGLQTALDGKSATSHTHDWASITSKPTTFTPSTHTHAISDVTSLQSSLDAKATLGSAINGVLTHDSGYMYIKRYNNTGSHSGFGQMVRLYYSGATSTNQLLFQVVKDDNSITYAKLVALSFDLSSAEESKKDIVELEDGALQKILDAKAYKYRFTDADDGRDRLGLVIGRETPEEVVNRDSKTVDIYGFTTLLMKAVQEQQQQIDELRRRLDEMEGR